MATQEKPLAYEKAEVFMRHMKESTERIGNEIGTRNALSKEVYVLLSDLAVDMPDFIIALGKAEKGNITLKGRVYSTEDELGEETPAWIIYSKDLDTIQEKYIRSLLELPLGVEESFEDGKPGSIFKFTGDTGSRLTGYMLVDVYMEHKKELDETAHRSREIQEC